MARWSTVRAMKRREGVHTGAGSHNVLGRFVWSVSFFLLFRHATMGMVIGAETAGRKGPMVACVPVGIVFAKCGLYTE